MIQPPDGPHVESERDGVRSRTTMFLIADLRGYTRFSDSRGDEAADAYELLTGRPLPELADGGTTVLS